MTVRLAALVLDTKAPEEQARFWTHALGWTIRTTGEHGIALAPTDTTQFDLVLRPGGADKSGQNRIHLDLTTVSLDDQRDLVAELLAIGGAHVDIGQSPDETHVVLADPEGNELCVIEPQNRFLAGCPRLGAVNCDGTRALGCFFSDALGWPLVWDQDEETAIQAPNGTGPKVTWSGPPLMPTSETERFHLNLAPSPGTSPSAALDHLAALGATRREEHRGCPGSITLADVDGNLFCLIEG